MARKTTPNERAAFKRLKEELHRAFASPENSYSALTAQDVIFRNKARRKAE